LDVVTSTQGKSSLAQVGREAACTYFFQYELPKIDAWLHVVSSRDMTCANLPEEAF
jgi:butyryl-CoA dehydrogenase